MTERHTRFRQRPDVLSRVLPEAVIARSNGTAHELTGVAAAAWSLLDAPRTVPALVEMLASWYVVPSASILGDVNELLDDLIERGLVEEIVDVDI